jgi:hypothetical protein
MRSSRTHGTRDGHAVPEVDDGQVKITPAAVCHCSRRKMRFEAERPSFAIAMRLCGGLSFFAASRHEPG